MKYSFRILIVPVLVWFALTEPAPGSVIFKPGEKARYQAPGEEQMSGTLSNSGQRRSIRKGGKSQGRPSRPTDTLVRRYPRIRSPPVLSTGWLNCRSKFTSISRRRKAMTSWPKNSPRANTSSVGRGALPDRRDIPGREKGEVPRDPIQGVHGAGHKRFFSAVVRAAPYGKYTARAQFDMGRAHEKQGANEQAIAAYQQW